MWFATNHLRMCSIWINWKFLFGLLRLQCFGFVIHQELTVGVYPEKPRKGHLWSIEVSDLLILWPWWTLHYWSQSSGSIFRLLLATKSIQFEGPYPHVPQLFPVTLQPKVTDGLDFIPFYPYSWTTSALAAIIWVKLSSLQNVQGVAVIVGGQNCTSSIFPSTRLRAFYGTQKSTWLKV